MQILSFPASRTGPTWQIARTTLLPAVLPPACGAITFGHLAGEFFTCFLRLAPLPLVAKLDLVRMIGFQRARASAARCFGARGAGTLSVVAVNELTGPDCADRARRASCPIPCHGRGSQVLRTFAACSRFRRARRHRCAAALFLCCSRWRAASASSRGRVP